jgi:Uma2 family endonuclease
MIAEILHDELILSPRPASPHLLASSQIGGFLAAIRATRRGGPPGGAWWILHEPELHQGGHVLVPDLAGWRTERMPQFPSTAAFELVPDWVCEVLSPSSMGRDRVKKRRIYQALGVAWYWLVDPQAQTVEVLELRAGEWMAVAVAGGQEAVALPPFEGVTIDLSELWMPDPSASETP